MDMKTLEPFIAENSFFLGLSPEYLAKIVEGAASVRFESGEYLFNQDEPADRFFVIRSGRVSVEISTPHLGPIAIQTLDEGEVVGWSWLFPPYEWNFDARAVLPTRAIALDGTGLRLKCERDPAFGYEMMKRCSAVMCERLQATRLQLMDMHKTPAG